MRPTAPIPPVPQISSWRATAERFGTLLLAVLYCFAIGHVATTAADADLQVAHHTAQGIAFSDASTLVLCPSTAAKDAVNGFSAPAASGFKELSKSFAAAIQATDRSQRAGFAERANSGLAVMLASWRSAILFPFHVFW